MILSQHISIGKPKIFIKFSWPQRSHKVTFSIMLKDLLILKDPFCLRILLTFGNLDLGSYGQLMLQGHKCCKVTNVARSQMLQLARSQMLQGRKCCKVANVARSQMLQGHKCYK